MLLASLSLVSLCSKKFFSVFDSLLVRLFDDFFTFRSRKIADKLFSKLKNIQADFRAWTLSEDISLYDINGNNCWIS